MNAHVRESAIGMALHIPVMPLPSEHERIAEFAGIGGWIEDLKVNAAVNEYPLEIDLDV